VVDVERRLDQHAALEHVVAADQLVACEHVEHAERDDRANREAGFELTVALRDDEAAIDPDAFRADLGPECDARFFAVPIVPAVDVAAVRSRSRLATSCDTRWHMRNILVTAALLVSVVALADTFKYDRKHVWGWRNPGDCKALVDRNAFYCKTGDCKALINANDFYCTSKDCKAIIDRNDFYCTTKDCKAIVDGNDFYCTTKDCKAIVDGNAFYCESKACKAIVDNNAFYCP
jgi:hypothetical protein